MNKEQVVQLMDSSKSRAEWDANCDKVKGACGGYPDFWYEAIVNSGLASHKARSFGQSAGIQVSTGTLR